MSRVISFRLDRNNPREAQALSVLSGMQEQGYSVRYTLTEALIRLDADEESAGLPVDEMNDLVAQMAQLLGQMQSGESVTNVEQKHQASGTELSDAFLASVNRASKPGIWLE